MWLTAPLIDLPQETAGTWYRANSSRTFLGARIPESIGRAKIPCYLNLRVRIREGIKGDWRR
jgi:hypothetical protein